jgi:copper(I)-binding protein
MPHAPPTPFDPGHALRFPTFPFVPSSNWRSRFMPSPARRLLIALALTASLVCPGLASANDFKVANAWTTVPDPLENATAYVVIQNRGAKDRTIVGGTCTGCDWVEIHRAVLKNGMMGSEKVDEMTVPAGGAVAFVPRGLSLELIGLEKLADGDKVKIELELKDGGTLEIEAVAREDDE